MADVEAGGEDNLVERQVQHKAQLQRMRIEAQERMRITRIETTKERHEARYKARNQRVEVQLKLKQETIAHRRQERIWWVVGTGIGLAAIGLLWPGVGTNWLLAVVSFFLVWSFAMTEIRVAIRDGISDSHWQLQEAIRGVIEDVFSGLSLNGDFKEAVQEGVKDGVEDVLQDAEINGLTEKITEAVEEGMTHALEQHRSI
jgi:Flp pilus assembly protein TadB